MDQAVPVAHRDQKKIAIAAAGAILIALTVAAITLLHPTPKPAQVIAPHLVYGQTVDLPHQITLTASRPVDDGTGHSVVYLTESSHGTHGYSTVGQRAKLGDNTQKIASYPFGMVIPGYEVTYRLVFPTANPDADLTFYPAGHFTHPITWSAR